MKDLTSYATHLPLLIKSIEATAKDNRPLLELGMGFSTMILHMMTKLSGREVYSFENDLKWLEENKMYASETHKLFKVWNWSEIDIDETHWGVVLVDHRPALDRKVQAMRLRFNADIILVHDSEPEIDRFYGYSRIYKHFKYVYHYTDCKPYTTALSNTIDVCKLFGQNPV